MDIIEEGKRVFDIEMKALEKTKNDLGESFVSILEIIVHCEGKLVITGMGKPGHIASKLAATFASLGTPAFYLHPGEAMHGDLGMISKKDVVLAISYSGESDEIISIIPNIKMIGARLIGLTGNEKSTLAKNADVVQVFPKFEEACYLGLAPTSSTTAALCYGDALAVVASAIYGFKDVDFGKFHPAGALGKKLVLRVSDIMAKNERNSFIKCDSSLKEAIVELSQKGLGAVSIVDSDMHLVGIITDGDLRRQLEKGSDIYRLKVEQVMTKKPIAISADKLAIDALNVMNLNNVASIPVVENDRVVGMIKLQDITSVGIVG